MKNSYSPPKLTIYGNVEKITQNTGQTPDTDFIIITGIPEIGDLTVEGVGGSSNFSTPFPTGS